MATADPAIVTKHVGVAGPISAKGNVKDEMVTCKVAIDVAIGRVLEEAQWGAPETRVGHAILDV